MKKREKGKSEISQAFKDRLSHSGRMEGGGLFATEPSKAHRAIVEKSEGGMFASVGILISRIISFPLNGAVD